MLLEISNYSHIWMIYILIYNDIYNDTFNRLAYNYNNLQNN